MSEQPQSEAVIEQVQRNAVIAEAISWLRTPYEHAQGVKGAGVDCAYFLIKVYSAAGIIEDFKPEHYSPQWALHKSPDGSDPEEKYLKIIQSLAHEIAGPPQMGDVAVYKFAHCFSHGAIVIEWPHKLIHAYTGRGVEYIDPTVDGHFTRGRTREVKFFSAWGK